MFDTELSEPLLRPREYRVVVDRAHWEGLGVIVTTRFLEPETKLVLEVLEDDGPPVRRVEVALAVLPPAGPLQFTFPPLRGEPGRLVRIRLSLAGGLGRSEVRLGHHGTSEPEESTPGAGGAEAWPGAGGERSLRWRAWHAAYDAYARLRGQLTGSAGGRALFGGIRRVAIKLVRGAQAVSAREHEPDALAYRINPETGALGGVEFVPLGPLAAAGPAEARGAPNVCVAPLDIPPRLVLLLPALTRDRFTGGPNTALQVAAQAAALGHRVLLVSVNGPAGPLSEVRDHLRDILDDERLADRFDVFDAHQGELLVVGRSDVVMATSWWTALRAGPVGARTNLGKFVYLLQDFEPLFYEWGPLHALAWETLAQDFVGIVNEEFLAEFFRRVRPGALEDEAVRDGLLVFEPAVDRARFYPEDDPARGTDGKRRLLVYARPGAPRNLWDMALEALRQLTASGQITPEEWTIDLMGEDLDPIALPGGFELRSLPWAGFSAYCEQVRETIVGLSPMLSPHTSYPPLEMAASGAVVVTTVYGPKSAARLAEISPNIIGVRPSAEAMAAGLEEAVRRSQDRAACVAGAALDMPRSWDEALVTARAELGELLQAGDAAGAIAGVPAAEREIGPSCREESYARFKREHLEVLARRYPAPVPAGFFSILTSAYETAPAFLDELAESLEREPDVEGFEWVLLDNGSTRQTTRDKLAEIGTRPWVRYLRVEENLGIIGGVRECLRHATGRYVLPTDSDDVMMRGWSRIYHGWLAAEGYPAAAYSDEDLIVGGKADQVYLKPDWDPVLFENSCYIAHYCAIERTRALAVGAYEDDGATGCHDWDTFLRLRRDGVEPGHLPAVIYSWRVHGESTAGGNMDSKSFLHTSHRHVLEGHLEAQGLADRFEVVPSPAFPRGSPDWWIRRRPEVAPRPVASLVLDPEAAEVTGTLAPGGRLSASPGMDAHHLLSELEVLAEADGLLSIGAVGLQAMREDTRWEAQGLFERFPETALVGGDLLAPDGTCRDGGSYFHPTRGVICLDAGRHPEDGGYCGQRWKQRTVDAVPSVGAWIPARHLQAFLRARPDVAIAAGDLGPWLGAWAARGGRRVIVSPFLACSGAAAPEVGEESRRDLAAWVASMGPQSRLAPLLALDAAGVPASEGRRLRRRMAWARSGRISGGRTPRAEVPTPHFSVLTSAYDTAPDLLTEAADSLLPQLEDGDEWVLVDNGSAAASTRAVLQELGQRPGVKLIQLQENQGILGGMRAAFESAGGEYVLPFDSDDLLADDALAAMRAELLGRRPTLLYSDEALLIDGRRGPTFQRPNWDPVLNACAAYVFHLVCFRRDRGAELGVYQDQGAEYCHDWDTVFRFASAGEEPVHVPRVLYFWRQHGASTTHRAGQHPGSLASQEHVLRRYLEELPSRDRYRLEEWPVDRGAKEYWVRRLPVDPPPIHLVRWGGGGEEGPAGDIPWTAAHVLEEGAGPLGLLEFLPEREGLVALLGPGVMPEGDRWFWEAVGLLERFPEVRAVSGRVLDDDGVVLAAAESVDSGQGWTGLGLGRSSEEPGAFGMFLKQQTLDAPTPLLMVAGVGALRFALREAPVQLSFPGLGRWFGLSVNRQGGRVGYSPLVEARRSGVPKPDLPPAEASVLDGLAGELLR